MSANGGRSSFQVPAGYLSDISLVDLLLTFVVATRQTRRYFTRHVLRDLAIAWGKRSRDWSLDQASGALASHRYAPLKRTHTCARIGFGPNVRWFYVDPSDVNALEQQAAGEMARRLITEHVNRIVPGAAGDPVFRTEIENAVGIVEGQLQILGQMISTLARVHTDPAIQKTMRPVQGP